jgi:hypothetical protein
MTTCKAAEDFLKVDCANRFQDKRKFFGLFGAFTYQPTGEKVEEDFGYFDCELGQVLDAFNRKDLAAMAQFPICDSEHRGPVRVDLFHTPSGSMVALQIVEYQNYNPTLAHVKAMIESD